MASKFFTDLTKNRRSLPQLPSVVNDTGSTSENGTMKQNGVWLSSREEEATKTITTPVWTKHDSMSRKFPKDKEVFKTTPVGRVKHGGDEAGFGTPDCYNHVVFDSPGKTPVKYRRSVGHVPGLFEEDSSSVTVAVRVRPFNQREIDRGHTTCAVSMRDNETIVTSESGAIHNFTYDHCFWSFSTKDEHFVEQQLIYEKLARPLLGSAFQGYNTCLFAYGQTGSGKSYSIMGQNDNPGIVPRFSEELFSRIENSINDDVIYHTEISYFEIYNEKIHDLLASTADRKKKKVPTATLR